nr:sporulation protein RMD1 [Ipomoea batatas]
MKLTMRTAWGHGAHRALLVADAGVLRTLFTLSAKPHPLTSHTLPLHHPISPPNSKPIALLFTPVLRRDSQFSTAAAAGYGVLRTGRSPNFGLAKCISSVSSSAHTVEWNDAISTSEAYTVVSAALPSIPVRAFFFSTRFASPLFKLHLMILRILKVDVCLSLSPVLFLIFFLILFDANMLQGK